MTDEAPPDAPGAIVMGQFRIRRELGRGGMGVVHEAWDEKLHRRVALKVLPEEIAKDGARRERFLREARAAAALSHRAIATVFQIEEWDGRLAIVMELAAGESLRRRLRGGALPLADALRIAKEVASALAAAHRAGIAHRDLKPENVMVSDEAVKLLDFGIAKALGTTVEGAEGDASTAGLTATGQVVGTAGYMAPEQASGEPIDQRADVFAFGVLLFEMLAGTLPFQGPTPLSRAVAVTRDPPRDLRRLAPDAPLVLVEVVLRCLEKSPTDRFQDGAALASALATIDAPVTSAERPRTTRVVTSENADADAATEAATPAPRVRTATSGVDDADPQAEIVALRSGRNVATLAVVGIGAAGIVALVLFARSSDPPPRRMPVSATSSVSSVRSTVSAAPAPSGVAPRGLRAALAYPCFAKDTPPPVPSGCQLDAVAWCDPQWNRIACCAKGLVPVGEEGACGCPPGGSLTIDPPVPGCPPAESNSMMDPQAIHTRITAMHDVWVACYERDLKDNPALSGKMDLAIRLAPDGRVFSARIAESSLPGSSAQSCVLEALRKIEFPAPRGALGYSTQYPLDFGPGEPPSPGSSAPAPPR